MNTQELISELEEYGYEWRPYSGRGMFGAQCVGVELDSEAALWDLARMIGDVIPAAPKTDNIGKRIIAYWPSAKLESENTAA